MFLPTGQLMLVHCGTIFLWHTERLDQYTVLKTPIHLLEATKGTAITQACVFISVFYSYELPQPKLSFHLPYAFGVLTHSQAEVGQWHQVYCSSAGDILHAELDLGASDCRQAPL